MRHGGQQADAGIVINIGEIWFGGPYFGYLVGPFVVLAGYICCGNVEAFTVPKR